MNPQPTLYRIQQGALTEELSIEAVWSQSGGSPLASGYGHIVPLTVGGVQHLVGFDASSGKGSAFRVQEGNTPLVSVPAALDLGRAFDVVEPFVLGNIPHLLAYASGEGDFSFFPIAADLRAQPPYTYRRVRQPGITSGFDVAQPIVVNGGVYVLCYSFKTGDVNAYSLSVTATPAPGSAPGTPPLLALPVWVHQWARDWTRFAFFQMGAENFFLKTNVGKLNVNIDHVLDDPSQGTTEVGTYLELENALKLDIVRAFSLGGGDPYFLTYMTDGTTTFNRFHADCQGWTKQASLATVTGARQIVTFRQGPRAYALFY
jgi:hypothetical protein